MKCTMDIQRVSNVNLVLDYMQEFKITRLVSNKDSVLGAGDIVGKNKSLVLGLIWSVYLHFVALELHGLNDLHDVKSKILDWVRIFTNKVPGVNVSNFTTDFKDGRVFLAILHLVAPDLVPTIPSPSSEQEQATANMTRAFDAAHERFRVPKLLDAADPKCCRYEHVVIMYLCEMKNKLPSPSTAASESTDVHDQCSESSCFRIASAKALSGAHGTQRPEQSFQPLPGQSEIDIWTMLTGARRRTQSPTSQNYSNRSSWWGVFCSSETAE